MRKTLFTSALLACSSIMWAQQITKADDGIKNYVAEQGLTHEIKFYSDDIVRVYKYLDKTMPAKKSYPVIKTPEGIDVDFSENGEWIEMKTECMIVKMNKNTGKVMFYDLNNNLLLQEKEAGVNFKPRKDGKKDSYEVSQRFLLQPGEVIYGLGQQQSGKLNQRNQDLFLRNENTKVCIPYISSEKGYGVFWDNPAPTTFSDTPQETSFNSEVGDMTDYYFLYNGGTQDGLMASLRDLSGQATMLPKWTLGFWQCRERYKSSDELCDVLDKYRELEIPLDGIVQDWQYWGCDSNWNAMKFMNPLYINKLEDPAWTKYLPNDLNNDKAKSMFKNPRIKSPKEMVEYVHKNNAHLMISIWPSFGPWTDQYKELKEINALIPIETWPRNAGVHPYDPFNSQARDIYWKYLKNLYDMDIDAWWTDATEPDHFDKKDSNFDFQTGEGTFRSVHNAYPLVTNMGIYEHQRAISNDKRLFLMTRSSYLGQQRYGSFCWSGDVVSQWSVMRKQIPAGINYSLCGIPYWNTDIGGFFGWEYGNNWNDVAYKELQVRWMQWGCFTPIMRNHCSSPMETEIYKFGKEGEWAFDVQKKFVELRYRLLPYIYSTSGEVTHKNGSMMRPFVMDFPKDRKALSIDNEYMFGRNLLVMPVTDSLYTYYHNGKGHAKYENIAEASEKVNVYLPAGTQWTDFWSNKIYQGGQEISMECPIDIMPVFVKAGAIIPFGPAVQYADEKKWDNLEIRVYPGADGSFTLYEDEGDNYNYENGAYTEINFKWNDKEKTLTIEDRKGKYKGMINKRKFQIVIVDENTPSGDKAATANKTVSYNGKKLTVQF